MDCISQNKKGYSSHPETLRWIGKLKALYIRHENLVTEMHKRNYNHHSDLDKKYATGSSLQNSYINTPTQQTEILKEKKCACKIL